MNINFNATISTSGPLFASSSMSFGAQPLRMPLLSNFLGQLAGALQNLSNLLGGQAQQAQQPAISNLFNPAPLGQEAQLRDALQRLGQPMISNQPSFGAASTAISSNAGQAPIAGTGRIWGDPHFIGADGDKYDVQGKAGKTYNLLSDHGLQVNGEFHAWGKSDGITGLGRVGIVTKYGENITVSKDGSVMVGSRTLKDGETATLSDGTKVTVKGKNATVETNEYTMKFQAHGNHMNMDVTTQNAVKDGVKPHGLLGQTFDGDGKALNGDKGTNAQGGGVLQRTDGSISARGDKNTVQAYEVNGLYDTGFANFNKNAHSTAAFFAGTYGSANTGYTHVGFVTTSNGAIRPNNILSMQGFNMLFSLLAAQRNSMMFA